MMRWVAVAGRSWRGAFRPSLALGAMSVLPLCLAGCNSTSGSTDPAAQARIAELEAELDRAARMLEDGLQVQYTQIPVGEAPPAVRERLEQHLASQPGFAGAMNAARAAADSPSRQPAAAHRLRGTVWTAGPDAQGAYVSLHFGDASLGASTDQTELLFLQADFAGVHPACLQQPLCVMTLAGDGTSRVQHYELDEEAVVLRPMQCLDWEQVGDGGPIPTAEALRTNGSQLLVRREGSVICLRDVDGLELRLYSGTL